MKIINCSKGGRVPEGYCLSSCLNYPCKQEKQKAIPFQKPIECLVRKQRSWLQTYKEDIFPRLKKAS